MEVRVPFEVHKGAPGVDEFFKCVHNEILT